MKQPTFIGRYYRVLREIGRGGMGVVYQVLDTRSGKQYALKVLLLQAATKAETVSRFKREIKMPSHIGSVHVVKVFESDTAEELDNAPFYVMELLHGCDIRRLIDKRIAFQRADVAWICKQVASCLDNAHKAGIVHRDLKPDNIFLHQSAKDGLQAKLLHFGIARINQELLESKDRGNLTATQTMLGTPLYMSPEQAMGGDGRELIGPSTDVWALGLIVFELLTGRSYWAAESLLQHLGQLLFANLIPPSQKAANLPPGFDTWFSRSCARAVTERFASTGEQINELCKLLGENSSNSASLTLINHVAHEAPPMVDHAGKTFSGPNQFASELDDEAQPAETSATEDIPDEVETVRFNRLSDVMKGGTLDRAGIPIEYAELADTVPTPVSHAVAPTREVTPSSALPTLVKPGTQRRSQPPAADESAPARQLASLAMATLPYRPPTQQAPAPSRSQNNLLGSADQDIKAELLGQLPPGEPASASISKRPLLIAVAAGLLVIAIAVLLLLSGPSTSAVWPVSPPDMTAPVFDLSHSFDLATVDMTTPPFMKRKSGQKAQSGLPKQTKDRSRLKFFVPPSL